MSEIDRFASAGQAIASSVRWSAATAMIPVPWLDLAGLAAVQIKLVDDIAKIYGQSFTKDAATGIVSVLIGSLLPGSVGNLLKINVGVGTILGAVTLSAFAAASTYALGKVIVRHFENGGTTSSFDAASVSSEFQKEFGSAQTKVKPA